MKKDKISKSTYKRLKVTKGNDWWINEEAEPNGIGPICLYCDRLIDWAPRDHAPSCPVPFVEMYLDDNDTEEQ